MFSIDVLDCILVLAIALWHYTILRCSGKIVQAAGRNLHP